MNASSRLSGLRPMILRLGVLAALASATLSCAPTPSWGGIVKIGVVAPFQGYDAATAEQVLSTAKPIVAEANGRGGARGRRIELVALDGNRSQAAAASKAGELALDRDVAGALVYVTGETAGAITEFARLGLPVVAVGGPLAAPLPMGVYAMCADAATEGQSAAQHAATNGSRRPAVVVADGEAYGAAAAAFARAVGGEARPIASRSDIDVVVRDVLTNNIDFVYFSGPYEIGLSLAAGIGAERPVPVLLGSDADTPAARRLLLSNSPVKRVSACGKAQPDNAPSQAQVDGVSDFKSLAAEATTLIVEAVSRSSQPDRKAVAAALGDVASANRVGPAFDRDHVRVGATATVQ